MDGYFCAQSTQELVEQLRSAQIPEEMMSV